MLKGKWVSLRAIEEKDLAQLLEWRNRPEFRVFFREHRELSMKNQMEWFASINARESNAKMFSIVSNEDGLLMGACGLCYHDGVNRSADLSIYLGRDNLYIDDNFAPDAAMMLLRYGFEEMGLHRIWAEIYDIDHAKKKFFEGMKFQLDGRFREAHWTQGKWCDSLFFSILDREFFGK